jgi:hypothetical protein
MTDPHPALQRFQMIVLADLALQQELLRTADRAAFVALVLARAREHDCPLDAAEIEAALDAAARAWALRGTER